MRGRLPAKYKWDDEWRTAKEIAELENVPLNTTRTYFSRCKGNADCVRKLMARRSQPRSTHVKFPYRDGRMLIIAEIIKLEPHMTSWKIKNRYKVCEPGDWERIFSRKRVQIVPRNGASLIESDEIGKGLGPRKNVLDIPGPSDYEIQLWNS